MACIPSVSARPLVVDARMYSDHMSELVNAAEDGKITKPEVKEAVLSIFNDDEWKETADAAKRDPAYLAAVRTLAVGGTVQFVVNDGGRIRHGDPAPDLRTKTITAMAEPAAQQALKTLDWV